MKRNMNYNMSNFIKYKRLLISLLILFIIASNLTPLYFSVMKFSQNFKSEDAKEFPTTSTSNGGGYFINDSASYSWIEISTSGTLMNISNKNDGYEAISFSTKGWNFTYYEKEYNMVFVSTNGWISFTNLGYTHLSCSPIPSLSNENIDCVAILCTDLNPIYGGEIYYEFIGEAPYNCLIIEYHNIFSNDNNYVGTFQVIFNQSGMIKFQYQNVNYLSQFDAVVGLDHGDLTNYNYFSGIDKNHLPYMSKAIEFTFNEILEINYSLNVKVDDEYTWIVTEIDNYMMDEIFGLNWEILYGIFPDPEKFSKVKINVTTIIENSTHWEINYSIWDWISKESNFNNSPDGNDLLIYLKEPLNYSVPHNLTHIFPLLIPTPIFHYINRSNLAGSYSQMSGFDPGGDSVELGDSIMSTTILDGHFIQFGRNAYYNKYGLLDSMDFYYINQSWGNNDKISIFTIYNFYDSPKPLFIGVNESDICNYAVFYSERNAPIIPLRNYSKIPNKFSLEIDFIGGFDPYFNRTLISINNSEAASAINPISIEKHLDKYYLPEILTRYTILNRFVLPIEVNWSYLDFIRSDIVSISNGFIISANIMNDTLEFEYQYTSNGLLNIYSEYNNGKEYFTIRLNDFNYQIDDSDPIINILNPQNYQTFGKNAPSYNLSIIEPNLDEIWYSLDGGLNNITVTSLNGTIDQTLWNAVPEGFLTIRFYANDTMGYYSYKDVIINKKLPSEHDKELIIIFIFIGIIGSVIAISTITFNYYQKVYKAKKREIPPFFDGDEEIYETTIRRTAKEILNEISNKKLLFNLFGYERLIYKKSIIGKVRLTTITDEFLRKIDMLRFNEFDKKEFLREMLGLSPKEREEILLNIISRGTVDKEQSSKDILKNLIDKNLLLQIFDEKIPLKKRIQLGKIELTTVSEKFLKKVDTLGLKGDMKTNFIKEMLGLSPKEREEIINNILDKKEKYIS